MTVIKYEKFLGGERVYLDGKFVGVIQSCKDGFFYQPKAGRDAGEVFETVNRVKRSLEEG